MGKDNYQGVAMAEVLDIVWSAPRVLVKSKKATR